VRADDKPLGSIEVGRQIDRHGDTMERHEDRYWDDFIVSSRAVGPRP
jgi:hypothetical protein